jgi:hypothetical protein
MPVYPESHATESTAPNNPTHAIAFTLGGGPNFCGQWAVMINYKKE